METLPKETLTEILLRSSVDDYPHLAATHRIAYHILNTERFWRMKYQYHGYSDLVFDFFDDQGDLEDYVYSYHRVVDTQKRMNNVLMTMVIESNYDAYKNLFIRISNIDDSLDIYLHFLKVKNNSYYKILSETYEFNGHLDIKYENGLFGFYLDEEEVLFFNKLDTIEYLMLYYKTEGKHLVDNYDVRYIDFINKDQPIGSRRQGIVATLQFFNK